MPAKDHIDGEFHTLISSLIVHNEVISFAWNEGNGQPADE